tara:strand:+ start:2560 stop:2715 length:156 start_codon:yes stop_codon:yes gene_type:complete
MKKKKHSKIVNDYENQKRKHLEKLASKALKQDERSQKLKDKKIKGKFLDKF